MNDLFAAIAPRYDLINDLQSFGLHRLWKRRLTRLAAPQPGTRVLDLCCGTGDVALAMAQAGAQVVGLDFSEAMLKVARERLKARQLQFTGGIEFIRSDALNVPFADGSFDVVTVSYGLRNLASWERGLREMWRVTKPNGRLLVLDFGKPANPFWRAVYFSYLRWVVPVFGKIFCGDSQTYAYILESLEHFPAPQGIAAAMRELRCNEVRIVNLLGGTMGIATGRRV